MQRKKEFTLHKINDSKKNFNYFQIKFMLIFSCLFHLVSPATSTISQENYFDNFDNVSSIVNLSTEFLIAENATKSQFKIVS